MGNDLLASFTLLTRLPFGRLRSIPADSYTRAVNGWSFVGWLTGGATAGVFWLAQSALPVAAALTIAYAVRVLLTGAMHEDGLGDFFDGFGGGRTRERTLEIMKDSRTGSYGVLGMILYYALLVTLLAPLPLPILVPVIAAGDPLAKFVATQVVNLLPYARTAEQSKIGCVYRRTGAGAWIFSSVAGLVPAACLLPEGLWWAALFPAAMLAALTWLMRRRIGGYTGDCLGAAFLLCELAFFIGIHIVGA